MKRREARPSVKDVAERAGVSLGTVSNVLNRPETVADETRERVRAAIDELGYVRNESARQLRAGSSRTIGLVVLDVANPFFTDVARGIEDRLDEAGYTLMLASSDEDPDREARYLRLFEEHGVQGLMVVPSTPDVSHLLTLRDRGLRVVLLDQPSPVEALSSVAVDDRAGAAQATRHLVTLGHERLAFINGPHTIRQCADRSAGIRSALAESGLDPDEALTEVTITSLNADGGQAGTEQVLALPDRPTATMCVNDLTALGALRALRAAQVPIPSGMAVVGYDDVTFAGELATPLTSVRQPTHQLGWRAADLLLTEEDVPEHVTFQPELIVRESTTGTA